MYTEYIKNSQCDLHKIKTENGRSHFLFDNLKLIVMLAHLLEIYYSSNDSEFEVTKHISTFPLDSYVLASLSCLSL